MSSETLNFGPEWLRNLSHGGGGGNNITSPPLSPAVNSSTSKFKLAKHRYGREEMLALFEEDTKIPASLQALPHILSIPTLIPLTLTPITAEDQQAFSGGVNSETTFRGRGFGVGRSRGQSRGRGRGRGGTDFNRSMSQNEEGLYPRMSRDFTRQSWDDRSNRSGVGVRHFDDPPPRSKPMRRADVSGNWRDDALRAGGDTPDVSPSVAPRVAGTSGGWRDATRGGPSWREWTTESPGGSGGSYRPPNRNHQAIRRSVSTGGASTTTPPPSTAAATNKYESGNENGGNNFLPEWAGDDDGDTEVGVFDSTGAFLPRSSVSTANDAAKKGATAAAAASTATSDNNNNGSNSDKKKTRRQSTLHSTLDKIDEQNHNDVAAAEKKNNHTATSGQPSPPSSVSPTTAAAAAAENHDSSSLIEDKPAGPPRPHTNETSPPNNITVSQSPIRGVVDDGTNNNNVSSPHKLHDENLNKAKELMALQQQQATVTTTSSSVENSVLRASSLIPNDVMTNDDYVPKAIPNTFQDPKKDAVGIVGDLLSRSKMNENFDGLAESTIRILDEADEQQRAPFPLFHHQQQQQQHEAVQQQPFDVATQHIKSLFASNQPSPIVSSPPQPAQANKWFYKDPQGEIQGPFNSQQMADWFKAGYFSSSLLVRRVTDSHFEPLGEMFRRHGRNPFTTPPVVQPVPHVIQQQQSQLIDQQQQQQQFRQEMQFRNFLQHTKEVQEQQLQAFKSMLINNLNKNPEFCAMSVSQQQATLNQQITIFQHQLNTQQQQQISQYLSNNAPAAASARTISAVSGGAAATPSSIVGVPGAASGAGGNHPNQVSASSHHESLNPWEVDPAIVRRPSPGATQQEQQHFMQLLKKKTAEQEQRSALKAREDMELEEKRKLEMQQRFQQEEAMRKAEELRKQRELILYRQRMEEECLRKEEEEKQKKIEEERLRQKLAKEEEARIKKAEEAEQLRLLQEKKLENQRKYEEERKRLVEEARKKKEQEEEEKRRKRREEEELEKKRRALEEEELKKKQAEEEYARRQRELQLREARKKKELEDLKKLNLPSTAQWAAQQNNVASQSRQAPTVAEIQKIEEAKERELRKRKEQEQKRIQMQQAQKQSTAPVWGGNAAQHLASNHVAAAPSLAEIQREEAKKAKQRQDSVQQQKTAVVTARDPALASNNSSTAAAAAAANSGKWSNRVAAASKIVSPTTTKKSGPAWGQTFQQPAHQQPVVWDQPTLAQSNDSKQFIKQQVRGKRRTNPVASEKNNVVALFENSSVSNPAKHSEVFFKWCSQEISKIPQVANFDIPTVFAFLCDVQSPYEVKDYIHEVFGDSQIARDFGDAFLKKRAEVGTQHSASSNNVATKNQQPQQQLSAASQRKSATMSPSAAAAAAAAAAELVTGNTKRGKRRQRKLQKIDPSILGFSVNAASDRVNMGEIDTPRDV